MWNRHLDSACEAVEFIRGGTPIATATHMAPADAHMITTGDENIERSCQDLCQSGVLRKGDVVFHCSGVLDSACLDAAREHGAVVASIHPIKSFASPLASAQTFCGTYCGLEGDAAACRVLDRSFTDIGGNVLTIERQQKVLWHAVLLAL